MISKRMIFLLISITSLSSACREDFDLSATFEEIPVVYCILSEQDSVHYIRVQRAFISRETNAFAIAQNPDSIYYTDILEVELNEVETGLTFTLERIEGDTIGLPKENGQFGNSPNIMYRLKKKINDGYTYRLALTNTVSGLKAHSETKIVGSFTSILPNIQYTINWSGADDEVVNFNWKTAKYASLYDLMIDFNYMEWDVLGEDTLHKTLTWEIFQNLITQISEPDFGIGYEYYTARFYQFIANHLPAENTKRRKAESVNFHLSAGGQAFAQYVSHQQAQTGITGQMATAPYSNIENALGFFSSRYTMHFNDIKVGAETRDSLVQGKFTQHLNFVK